MLYMNNIQAICFGINDWSTDEARKFLKIHDITPIKKVHKTKSFLRYRILQPNYNKYIYRIKTIQKKPLIKFILQYNK